MTGPPARMISHMARHDTVRLLRLPHVPGPGAELRPVLNYTSARLLLQQPDMRTVKVSRNATDQEIKSSYRQLMRKYHPDMHAGNPQKQKAATELSMRVTTASQVSAESSSASWRPRPTPR